MQQLKEKLEEKALYEHFEVEARRLLYPDLRAGYKKHEKMLSTLTKAFVAVHKMAMEDEEFLYYVSKQSIFDTDKGFTQNIRKQPIPSFTCDAPYAISSQSEEYGSGIQSWQYTEDAAYDIVRRLRVRGDTHIKIEKQDANGDLQPFYEASNSGEK